MVFCFIQNSVKYSHGVTQHSMQHGLNFIFLKIASNIHSLNQYEGMVEVAKIFSGIAVSKDRNIHLLVYLANWFSFVLIVCNFYLNKHENMKCQKNRI